MAALLVPGRIIACSAHGLAWVAEHTVLSDMIGSDHRPLSLTVEIPCRGPCSSTVSSPPVPLVRVIWDPEKLDAYIDAITNHPEVAQLLQNAEHAALEPPPAS